MHFVLPDERILERARAFFRRFAKGEFELMTTPLLIFEVANALWKAVRVGRIEIANALAALNAVKDLRVPTLSLLVPKEHLTRIAGLNQTMQGLLSIVSPPLGAIAVSFLPMYGVMGIDVFTFIFAVAPLLVMAIPEPERTKAERPSYFADLREGFRYVWGWRGLFLLLCLAALLNGIAQPMSSLLPLLVKDHFGKGALELGWAESAWGIGVMLGGLLLAAWCGFRKKIHTILLGIVGMGAGFFLVGFLPPGWFYGALGLFLFAGLMNPIANSPFMALVQSTVPPGMQGRVFSLMNSMAQGMAPLSLLLAGPLADLFGVRFWYLVGGAGVTVLGLVAFAVPAIMRLEEHRPVAAGVENGHT